MTCPPFRARLDGLLHEINPRKANDGIRSRKPRRARRHARTATGRHVCFVLRLPNSFSRQELLVFQFNISPHRSDTPVNKHALNHNTRHFNEHAPHDPELRPITQHPISPFRLPRGAVSDLFSLTEGRLLNSPAGWFHFPLPFTRAMPGLPCRHPASAALADSRKKMDSGAYTGMTNQLPPSSRVGALARRIEGETGASRASPEFVEGETPFDTPPSAATQGEERGVGGLRRSQTRLFQQPPQGGSEISSLPGRLHTPNHEIRSFPTASKGTGRDLSLQRRIPHRSGLAKEERRGIRRKGRGRRFPPAG